MKKAFDIITVIIFLLSAAFLLFYPDQVKNSAFNALCLCARSVVPSLFPFAILASLFLSSPAFNSFAGALPLGKIFGLSQSSSCAVLFGWLFGFPLGAKCAVDLYSAGKIGKDEAETLLAVSNNSGPAFIVNVIGASFWVSSDFGLMLYIMQILSGLFSGILISRVIYPVKICKAQNCPKSILPFSKRFTDAVKSSAQAMINICAFICAFSVITEIIGTVIRNKKALVIVSSFLELTSSSQYSALLGGRLGTSICAFAVGFSGLSVIFQAASFAIPAGLGIKKLFIAKLLQGAICALLMLPHTPPAAVTAASSTAAFSVVSYVLGALFLIISAKKVLIPHKM